MTAADEKKEDIDFIRETLLEEFGAFLKTARGKKLVHQDVDAALLGFSEMLVWSHSPPEGPSDDQQQG